MNEIYNQAGNQWRLKDLFKNPRDEPGLGYDILFNFSIGLIALFYRTAARSGTA